MATPRIRVAAYVIRHSTVPELLVFDHLGMPEAGTQVPAGGVRPGEDLRQAVVREVAEETGLLTASVIREIVTEDKPHPETGQPRRTTFFWLQAPTGTANAWDHRVWGDGDDSGFTFACCYLPLPLKQALADDQDTHLSDIDPLWATARSQHPRTGSGSSSVELLRSVTGYAPVASTGG
ncbi:NUDIX domain-containing protein [Streptomyces sp. NBC_01617]|uniref:NUDIX hydrolase n=1 Tax=Streptomyces sp. NBC_01617 TaxID=2975899 RepID=UPI00386AD611|nr:NUDIX domain-containing protein [Streptomyces sp. NBC_01617]